MAARKVVSLMFDRIMSGDFLCQMALTYAQLCSRIGMSMGGGGGIAWHLELDDEAVNFSGKQSNPVKCTVSGRKYDSHLNEACIYP